MQKRRDDIKHSGKVLSVEGRTVKVEILAETACGACHARAVCGVPKGESRIVTAVADRPGEYSPGEEVNVVLRQSSGFRAVAVSYLAPLFVLIVLLLTLPLVVSSELVMGLTILAFIALYYVVLGLFRNRLAKGFVFTVEKID